MHAFSMASTSPTPLSPPAPSWPPPSVDVSRPMASSILPRLTPLRTTSCVALALIRKDSSLCEPTNAMSAPASMSARHAEASKLPAADTATM